MNELLHCAYCFNFMKRKYKLFEGQEQNQMSLHQIKEKIIVSNF